VSTTGGPLARLVIAVDGETTTPLRYAATAAAMDVAVELHAIGTSVRLFARSAAPETLAQVRQAHEFGVELYVCPVALAASGLRAEDLIDEVRGQRGAAALLGAALETNARFVAF
jgi:predicted peroxiredoxin